LEVSDAQGLRSLEEENSRLKRLVADLSLDKAILKAVITLRIFGLNCGARACGDHLHAPPALAISDIHSAAPIWLAVPVTLAATRPIAANNIDNSTPQSQHPAADLTTLRQGL
jgi:hypothetical protein